MGSEYESETRMFPLWCFLQGSLYCSGCIYVDFSLTNRLILCRGHEVQCQPRRSLVGAGFKDSLDDSPLA